MAALDSPGTSLPLGVCDGECAGMAGPQLLALKGMSPFPAFKLSVVSLEESSRCYTNAVHLAAQARDLIAALKVTLKDK